uniref:LRR receptor-like serine/threonine-protein kinase EFR n=1 Tax=Aegilops tauschii TaxID=37682 RepID=R7WB24_AEGTA
MGNKSIEIFLFAHGTGAIDSSGRRNVAGVESSGHPVVQVAEQSLKRGTLSMVILLAFLLLLFYGAGNINCSTVNHKNMTDMLSLLDFKAATNDPTGALRSWDRSVHYYNSTGVRCSQGNPGRVAALQLPGECLSGEITPSLENLTFLKVLNLSSNGFSGQLTPLNQLIELVLLDLSSNSFQGIIPDPLTNCSNLKILDLSRNMLEGPVPTKIGSLYNLLAIDLSSNNLTGVVPPTISNATELQLLNLQYNQVVRPHTTVNLQSDIPYEVRRIIISYKETYRFLSGLITIQMEHNNLTGGIPTSLGNLLNLNMLNLSTNNLSGTIPVVLGDLQLLSKLDISYTRLRGAIPRNGVFENAAAVSLDGNWELCGGATDLHVPSCRHYQKNMVCRRPNLCRRPPSA